MAHRVTVRPWDLKHKCCASHLACAPKRRVLVPNAYNGPTVRRMCRLDRGVALAALLVSACAYPRLESVPPAERSTRGEAERLRTYVESYAARQHFTGTVLVQRADRELYRGSFGLASRVWNVKATDSTRYRVASVTKMFTSVLIMRLYERGLLDLEATIGTYLPNYTGDGRDRVKVSQLLNHTSGIANIDARITSKEEAIRTGIEHYQRPLTIDELIQRYCSGDLVSEPGSVFSYNNADYMILGKIVEVLHGKPFDAVLHTELLDPLGMDDTGFLHQGDIIAGLAETYITRAGIEGLTHDLPVYWENWHAAGAMYSSVDDMLRFSRALFGGRLLRPSTLERMLTPGLDGYGYGLWIRDEQIGARRWKSILRPGAVMGARAAWYHVLEPDLTVIILANSDQPDTDGFAYGIGRLLLE